MATESEIMRGVARVGRLVDGIAPESVFGPGAAAPDANGVRGLPDDIDPYVQTAPAFMVLETETEVMWWGRTNLECEGSIWTAYQPRAENHTKLIDLREPIATAFRAHSKGFLVDQVVQSVMLTGFGKVEGRQWRVPQSPDDQATPTYLVMPFSIQVALFRPVTYQPA